MQQKNSIHNPQQTTSKVKIPAPKKTGGGWVDDMIEIDVS